MMDREQGAFERPARLKHDQYTVGWICALPIEMAASRAMLDREHEDLSKIAHDPNEYVLGNIGTHNIVMACLPAGQYGTNNAAIVASNMLRSFRAIRVRLMVGIGGGVPSDAVDIRLGDVVVGTRIIQYDLGKIVSQEQYQRIAIPKTPPQHLLNAISKLHALHESTTSIMSSLLHDMLGSHPNMSEYAYPVFCTDWLFHRTYDHDHPGDCHLCDHSSLLLRPSRQTDIPKIHHYGGIGSGNQVVKNARIRDILAKELDVVCFEMEAAGLMDHFPCIPIRGICDYADSHKNKQWQKYAAATAASYAKELLLTMVPNLREEMAAAAGASNIPESKSLGVQINARARRKELLDLLRFEQLDSRYTSIKAADRRTCEWFQDHDVYKNWLKPTELPQHHGFLWIRGKPGAGKSTLMKFAFNQEKLSDSTNAATASFFFHARGDDLEKSTVGMYRSLLLQLLETFPDLQSTLDSIPGTVTACPGIEILKEIFENAILALKHRKFACYVDALDECDEDQILNMIQHFENLGNEAATDQINLRICFASRHYPHIDIERGLKLTMENQKGHAADLKKYIERHLLNIGSRVYTENIQDKLLAKSEGVFIWVVLVVEILNKEIRNGRTFAIQERLRQIPSRLSELFRDMIVRDGSNADDLLLCIIWILYAKRPLRPQVFYFAILSGLPNESLVPYNQDQFTTEVMERYVVGSSKGLAEIAKTNDGKTNGGIVQFIHESVREFFVKERGWQAILPMCEEDFEAFGHDILKKCCISQITLNMQEELANVSLLPKAQRNQLANLRSTLSKRYPFLPYAIEHVFHHANAAALSILQTDFLQSFPLCKWVLLQNILDRLPAYHYTGQANLLYILAAHGNFEKLLEACIAQEFDLFLRSEGERYSIPLIAALARGNDLAARVIVSGMGGTANDYTSILKDFEDKIPFQVGSANVRSPIFWAIESGLSSIAALLVSANRFDLDERDSELRTTLHVAAMEENLETIQNLLNAGSDIEACCKDHKRPLSYAASLGRRSTVRLLIERGACIEAADQNLRTPLHLAACQGHDTIVQFLSSKRANINALDIHLQTPLHVAVDKGHAGIVRILSQGRTYLNALDENKQTALHIAADKGHEGIVRVLIEGHADTNVRDEDKRTPLHIAADRGHGAVVRALTQGHADVHAVDREKQTPLHIAVKKRHDAVVQILIQEQADINALDQHGETPMHIATRRGLTRVLQVYSDIYSLKKNS